MSYLIMLIYLQNTTVTSTSRLPIVFSLSNTYINIYIKGMIKFIYPFNQMMINLSMKSENIWMAIMTSPVRPVRGSLNSLYISIIHQFNGFNFISPIDNILCSIPTFKVLSNYFNNQTSTGLPSLPSSRHVISILTLHMVCHILMPPLISLGIRKNMYGCPEGKVSMSGSSVSPCLLRMNVTISVYFFIQ